MHLSKRLFISGVFAPDRLGGMLVQRHFCYSYDANLMYHSFKQLDVELYMDEKSPDTKSRVEEVLTQHNIYYTKTESYIESEKLYEVLYEMEV